ncbi:GL15714 [Drosophila persimilis]|uniref:GL15714 n=1 Tax=Drosophila persimilis TaxID=7234 RepID=B4H8Z0_DROPE|nr:uncharacterized protein LOC6602270 [Drosophila persimilis]EDW35205.1 GL15714 [Drosophila persimilis]
METYLTEIKQLRIPRPKFEPNSCHQQHQHAVAGGTSTSSSTTSNTPTPPHHHQRPWRHFVRPFTPPRDYHLPMVAGGGGGGGGGGAWSVEEASMHDKI